MQAAAYLACSAGSRGCAAAMGAMTLNIILPGLQRRQPGVRGRNGSACRRVALRRCQLTCMHRVGCLGPEYLSVGSKLTKVAALKASGYRLLRFPELCSCQPCQ